MNPLRIAAWAVQLVCDLFAPVQAERVLVGQHAQKPWPDGEMPLIDGRLDVDARLSGSIDEPNIPGYGEPMPGWYGGDQGFVEPSSAEFGAMEAKFEALGLFDHPKLGGWYREVFSRSKSSAGSAAPEAGVDPVVGPTPGRDHTPGVGHMPCSHPFGYDHPCARCGRPGGNVHLTSPAVASIDCSCDEHTDAYLYDPGHHPACISQLPKVTAGLLISAAIGLRDYADSDACEAPVYWRSIASQLDPK